MTSTFTKKTAIEISFVTFTLALACFSTLTVNEFITNFLSLCQICPKRFSISLQDLLALGPLCLLPLNMSSLIGSTKRICCTRTDCDGRMLSKQHNFQEKRCCVAELTIQYSCLYDFWVLFSQNSPRHFCH